MRAPRRRLLPLLLALPVLLSVGSPAAASAPIRLRVTASPSAVNFGKVAVGQESTRTALYVTNASKVPLAFQGIVIDSGTGAFWMDFDNLVASCWSYPNAVIPPGATCSVAAVWFVPGGLGLDTGLIRSGFTDGVTQVIVNVNLRGTGV